MFFSFYQPYFSLFFSLVAGFQTQSVGNYLTTLTNTHLSLAVFFPPVEESTTFMDRILPNGACIDYKRLGTLIANM